MFQHTQGPTPVQGHQDCSFGKSCEYLAELVGKHLEKQPFAGTVLHLESQASPGKFL